MSGIYGLSKLQMGKHSSSDSGDAIPATSIWRGTGAIEDARDLHYIPENVGILVGTDRTNTSQWLGKLALDATPSTYEQLPYILEMGIKGATPTSDSGNGSGWIRTYTLPTTAGNTIQPYCWQGGDNQQAEVSNYMHCLDFTLSGNEGKEWMMSANLFGRTVAKTTFTAGLTIPSVTEMNFGQSKLYIDSDSDSWGTTLMSNTMLQASLKYSTGLVAKYPAAGRLDFSFVQTAAPEITLTVTFEHDTYSVNEKDDWRLETPKLIRILNQGIALSTAGVYTYKTMIIDLAGKWLKFAKLGNKNGNSILEGTFTGKYNITKASAGQIVVVNELSTLP
jgi:hypothetical protein